MVSLKTVGRHFHTIFRVLEGGTGIIHGELTETEQSAQPSYVFVQPRHVLRTDFPTAVKTGMVIQSPAGDKFIVGDNGPSEGRTGTIWQSFRLIEATGRYTWFRRTKITDPITRTDREGTPQDMGLIWAALEPMDRVQYDREIHYQFPQVRVITGSQIRTDDLIDNRAVSKLDKQLGLSIGLLT